MPGKSPYEIVLTDEEQKELEKRSNSYTMPQRDVERAKMILAAANGEHNTDIAQRLDCARKTVSKWRKRFFEERLEGLKDRPRSGRPAAFSP